jgi:hypothetical protein
VFKCKEPEDTRPPAPSKATEEVTRECAYTAPAPKIKHADDAAYLANDFVPEDEHDVSAPLPSREDDGDEEEETSRGAASAFAW